MHTKYRKYSYCKNYIIAHKNRYLWFFFLNVCVTCNLTIFIFYSPHQHIKYKKTYLVYDVLQPFPNVNVVWLVVQPFLLNVAVDHVHVVTFSTIYVLDFEPFANNHYMPAILERKINKNSIITLQLSINK